jgi:hypothetical protein
VLRSRRLHPEQYSVDQLPAHVVRKLFIISHGVGPLRLLCRKGEYL